MPISASTAKATPAMPAAAIARCLSEGRSNNGNSFSSGRVSTSNGIGQSMASHTHTYDTAQAKAGNRAISPCGFMPEATHAKAMTAPQAASRISHATPRLTASGARCRTKPPQPSKGDFCAMRKSRKAAPLLGITWFISARYRCRRNRFRRTRRKAGTIQFDGMRAATRPRTAIYTGTRLGSGILRATRLNSRDFPSKVAGALHAICSAVRSTTPDITSTLRVIRFSSSGFPSKNNGAPHRIPERREHCSHRSETASGIERRRPCHHVAHRLGTPCTRRRS